MYAVSSYGIARSFSSQKRRSHVDQSSQTMSSKSPLNQQQFIHSKWQRKSSLRYVQNPVLPNLVIYLLPQCSHLIFSHHSARLRVFGCIERPPELGIANRLCRACLLIMRPLWPNCDATYVRCYWQSPFPQHLPTKNNSCHVHTTASRAMSTCFGVLVQTHSQQQIQVFVRMLLLRVSSPACLCFDLL